MYDLEIKNLSSTGLYSYKKVEKNDCFLDLFNKLSQHHYNQSTHYRTIVDSLFNGQVKISSLEDAPYVPIQLFKEFKLLSVAEEDVFRELRSSGTSGSKPSRVILDKDTANLQTRTLVDIVSYEIGKSRMPMLAIDSKSVIEQSSSYSARTAANIGFSRFSNDLIFCLDDSLRLEVPSLEKFVLKHSSTKSFLFGFTFLVWQFLDEVEMKKISINLKNSILIHGGGWKKMEDRKVSKLDFQQRIKNLLGIERVIDYYGMAEQVGSIFMECPSGFFHTTSYSEVIIRDIFTHKSVKNGKEGLIQLLSLLPKSYPGHSILTEDLGMIIGEDDCTCGRLGKYFKVLGRLKEAEIRGCSDTVAV
jgi:phenylacetate-coenzyme A ligase PaaK-like adenylate-forming protein